MFWGYCVCVLVAQSCLTLCDPMDCSPPGSSVPGILQAIRLEWVAISFSNVSFSSSSLVAKLCPALATPQTSLPCSSAHGILQARILEWVNISFSIEGNNDTLFRHTERPSSEKHSHKRSRYSVAYHRPTRQTPLFPFYSCWSGGSKRRSQVSRAHCDSAAGWGRGLASGQGSGSPLTGQGLCGVLRGPPPDTSPRPPRSSPASSGRSGPPAVSSWRTVRTQRRQVAAVQQWEKLRSQVRACALRSLTLSEKPQFHKGCSPDQPHSPLTAPHLSQLSPWVTGSLTPSSPSIPRLLEFHYFNLGRNLNTT